MTFESASETPAAGRRAALLTGSLALALTTQLHAQTTNAPATPTTRLPEVVIRAEPEYAETVQPPFLPAVEGTKINAGKKTSVIDLDEMPKINNNNYRQALALTPGLLLSEETSPLVSIGYRGLAPHRAQFTQVLKDGIPIHADMFGYPEAYYTPPLDTVDRIEFVHGGASLMFGPQPGGSLNYVTHMPRTDKEFSVRSQHILGSDNLYSTFNSIDGTSGRLGYYAYFNHRQTDGFRQANSDVELWAGAVKLVLDADKESRWILNFDGYAEEHGEPGGLRLAPDADPATTDVIYGADRTATSRFNDRFRLERYMPSLTWERTFSEQTEVEVKAWGGYYSRFSKRQATGLPAGAGFGHVAIGGGNSIELQEFYTKGVDARIRHDWTTGDNTHSFAGGVMVYHTDSPRVDKAGATPTADDGTVIRDTDRDILYTPVFLENRFVFGKFSVTPGLRVENIWQNVREKVNTAKTLAGTPLGVKDDHAFVPLAGIGLEYEVKPKITAYGNVSQAYRPIIFTEAVPTGGGAVINNNLDEGSSWQYEIGLRGNPQPWITWDASVFWLDFDNQIGTVGATVQNVGRSLHKGVEGALELDLIGLADYCRDTDYVDRLGSFSLYGNMMLLDASFESGPQMGRAPQYAPEYLVRTGAIYRWGNRVKIAFLGTFVDDHFADDANSTAFQVPAYMTWDLTAEVKVYKDYVSVVAGINNVFDEDYYARIRGDGIDPAYGRNYYAGLSFAF
ncbi:MAG: TonB-dependent receptor [Verrucomicrobiota bacterium]